MAWRRGGILVEVDKLKAYLRGVLPTETVCYTLPVNLNRWEKVGVLSILSRWGWQITRVAIQ